MLLYIRQNNAFSVKSCKKCTVRNLNVRSEGQNSLNLTASNFGKLYIVGNIPLPGILYVHISDIKPKASKKSELTHSSKFIFCMS